MLVCAECGYAYGGAFNNGRRYYQDGGRKHRSVRADLVEEKVWAAVEELLLNPSALWHGHQAKHAEILDQKAKVVERLATLHKNEAKAGQKLEALLSAYTDPDIQLSRVKYLRRCDDIRKEMAEWESEAQGIQEQLDTEAITQAQMEAIEEFASKVSQGIDLLGFEEKQKVLRMLEVRGTIHWKDGDASVELEGVFPPTEIGLLVSYKTSAHCIRYRERQVRTRYRGPCFRRDRDRKRLSPVAFRLG